jgi:hypothetical protein
MATAKAVSQLKTSKTKVQEEDENRPTKPKKLSKAGLWLEAHPNGMGGTYDMRAVMR